METEWGRQVAAVAAVLGLLGAALAWLGRRGQLAWRGLPRGRRAGALEIVEGRALRPGVSLHLVRVGNRTLLLAAHAQGCTLVDALPDRDGREEADRCA
ncbi:MAG: flagellar biosynthetic protein FliO [Bryobacterales bacterium]|nr:flagellar biosynthetic protein FliO [Bryobacterales bacterium]